MAELSIEKGNGDRVGLFLRRICFLRNSTAIPYGPNWTLSSDIAYHAAEVAL